MLQMASCWLKLLYWWTARCFFLVHCKYFKNSCSPLLENTESTNWQFFLTFNWHSKDAYLPPWLINEFEGFTDPGCWHVSDDLMSLWKTICGQRKTWQTKICGKTFLHVLPPLVFVTVIRPSFGLQNKTDQLLEHFIMTTSHTTKSNRFCKILK